MNEIIEDLMKNNWLRDECRKFTNKDIQLADDLVQELVLYIIEKQPEKLQEAFSKNEHKFFVKRMILNQIISTSSPFYRKYRKYVCDDIEDLIKLENQED